MLNVTEYIYLNIVYIVLTISVLKLFTAYCSTSYSKNCMWSVVRSKDRQSSPASRGQVAFLREILSRNDNVCNCLYYSCVIINCCRIMFLLY